MILLFRLCTNNLACACQVSAEQRIGTQSHRLIQCYLYKASLIWPETPDSPFKIL